MEPIKRLPRRLQNSRPAVGHTYFLAPGWSTHVLHVLLICSGLLAFQDLQDLQDVVQAGRASKKFATG
jgi:hypothetical protein